MKLEEFTSLCDRIQTTPSILLLGQNYLSMGDKLDKVWYKLSTDNYRALELPERTPDYPLLWEKAVKSPATAGTVYEEMNKVEKEQPDPPAVKALLDLRWSLIFTSSLLDFPISSRGITDVPQNERNANHKYLNKDRRYRVNLCGDRTNLPILTVPGRKKRFENQINREIEWITTYLQYYGVLVIDGLDIDRDWLTDRDLFGHLFELPPNSVYWFHAPKTLDESARALADEGILVTEPESFYEQMQRHAPELFIEREDIAFDTPDANGSNAALTLKYAAGQMSTLYVDRSSISEINGSNLCLLDDFILYDSMPPMGNRAQKFAEFLTQTGVPNWGLFKTQTGATPFYIQRNADETLEKKVYTALKKNGAKRDPVILAGPSNSGKSMMLANLALTIARRGKYPVLYIRGDLLQGAEKRLREFINHWFCDPEQQNGKLPEKTLLIWDGSGLKRSEQDYADLQQMLFTQNVQVVGSVYRSSQKDAVNLSANLEKNEEDRLNKILISVGGNYAEHFAEIQKRKKALKNSADSSFRALQNSSLLFWLEELFRYEFDKEYRDLEKILRHQFKQEKIHSEQQTSKILQDYVDYVDEFLKVQATRTRLGFAASFQAQLRLYWQKRQEEDPSEADLAEPVSEADAKEEHLKRLQKSVEKLNEILALAGEFGVRLPLTLLIHFMQETDESIQLTDDVFKMVQVLSNDTLIEFENQNTDGEQYYVRFRSPMEAENCICMLCDVALGEHPEVRKRREVDILKSIIQKAQEKCEILSVIELIRQFGPNGHGMISDTRTKSYQEFKLYWYEIAEEVNQYLCQNPEAVLVYAHLIREYYALPENQGNPQFKEQFHETLENARTLLEANLQEMEANHEDTPQYSRLSVELCANYQQALREQYRVVYYDSIKKRIRQAFQKSRRNSTEDLRWTFSSNFMLDILLNAYNSYREYMRQHPSEQTAEAADQELTEILSAIDGMLDLESLMQERNAAEIVDKIQDVYAQLGSDTRKEDLLEEQLSRANSDICLYLQARKLWQNGNIKDARFRQGKKLEPLDMIRLDRYTFLLQDIPYQTIQLPDELMEQIREDAANVVAFLTKNWDEVRRTSSARCVAMLLRAQWFLETGGPMLAERQLVSISRDMWEKINRECSLYASLMDGELDDAFAPAYFLLGVYQWTYGDPKRAIGYFEKAKAGLNQKAQSLDRLVLCAEESHSPRTFQVIVCRTDRGKYKAEIQQELSPANHKSSNLIGRYGMGVSDNTLRYLFNGRIPQEGKRLSTMPAVISFNLIGAQVESPKLVGGEYSD